MENSNEKLAPCPFCGSKPRFEKRIDGTKAIVCDCCGLQMVSTVGEQSAVLFEKWNTRVDKGTGRTMGIKEKRIIRLLSVLVSTLMPIIKEVNDSIENVNRIEKLLVELFNEGEKP